MQMPRARLGSLHLTALEFTVIQAASRRTTDLMTAREIADDTGLSPRLVGQVLRKLKYEWFRKVRLPGGNVNGWRLVKTCPTICGGLRDLNSIVEIIMTREECEAYLSSLPLCDSCGRQLSFFRVDENKSHYCPYCGAPASERKTKQLFQHNVQNRRME